MAALNYSGTGIVASTDYHAVKWVGKTKNGKAVTIELEKAINLGNIDWAFAEKDDVVSEVIFTSVYNNTDSIAEDTAEPWSISVEDGVTKGASEIMLGSGIFYIDDEAVALTRGGGSFNVEREFRNINADGDRGPVEGRIVMDASTATLTMNVLTILTSVSKLYSCIQ